MILQNRNRLLSNVIIGGTGVKQIGSTSVKCATATLAIVSLLVFADFGTSTLAQRRRGQRQPATRNNPKPARDYSVFKHADHRKDARTGAEIECSSCHIISAPAQPDRISAKTKPESKSSFPYHDSCFGCHREQVYRGDKPQICTVCHTRVSPRATANDLYAQFPRAKLGDVIVREFPGYFPHGLHQSVFALNRSHDPNGNLFTRISFPRPADDPEARDICATCHFRDTREVIPLPTSVQADDTFKQIETDTFRKIPGSTNNGHAFCFTCHWQAQKPARSECNGCHLAESDYKKRALSIIEPPALSANAIKWFKDWPKDVPKRFSLKFRHDTHTRSADEKSEVNNHDLGCATCHINIARMTTLNIPKADVPIAACGPCHSTLKAISTRPGASETTYSEISLKQDAAKRYTCVACHVEVIGREQPPCSHYQVIGQPCPKANVVRH